MCANQDTRWTSFLVETQLNAHNVLLARYYNLIVGAASLFVCSLIIFSVFFKCEVT